MTLLDPAQAAAIHAAYDRAGQGVCVACMGPVPDSRSHRKWPRCVACNRKFTERYQTHDKLVEARICVTCREPLTAECTTQRCDACSDKFRRYVCERRAAAKGSGKCLECQLPNDTANRRLCTACRLRRKLRRSVK